MVYVQSPLKSHGDLVVVNVDTHENEKNDISYFILMPVLGFL